MEVLMHQKNRFVLILLRQRQSFVWVFIIFLFVNGKEIYKFKASNKNNDFPSQFRLESISIEFDCLVSREVCLKGSVHDFSVDYNAIDKIKILNIDKYLMIKNNI